MKYIVVLGIEFQKYKKPVKISVSTGGRLIDEFDLNENLPGSESEGKIGWPDFFDVFCYWNTLPNLKDRLPTLLYEQPRFFKVYKLEDSQLVDNLVISVANDNNNYTNGFMTKSSKIRFQVIAMFPENMIKDNGKKLFDVTKKFREAVLTHRFKSEKGKSLQVEIPSRVCWPAIYNFTPIFQNAHLHKEMLKGDYPGWLGSPAYENWQGGTFKIILPIKLKHKLKYLHSHKENTHGFWHMTTNIATLLSTCKPLINSYNENQ